MKCSRCETETDGKALSYLGEPICEACALDERDDGTDEALVENYAREHGLAPTQHWFMVGGTLFEVCPGDGRDWTAVAVDERPDGVEVIAL